VESFIVENHEKKWDGFPHLSDKEYGEELQVYLQGF